MVRGTQDVTYSSRTGRKETQMTQNTEAQQPKRTLLWVIVGVVAAVIVAVVVWFLVSGGNGTSSSTGAVSTPSASAVAPGGAAGGSAGAGAGSASAPATAADGASAQSSLGQCPTSLPIKADGHTGQFYEPSNPKYASVKADYCFKDAATAQKFRYTQAS